MANEVAAPVGVNQAIIIGELVAEPKSRELPSGSVAMSFSLTVRTPGHKTTSVPLVWYDPPKRVAKWFVGQTIVATGSVVRRFYRGGSGLASSTEVVVARADRWSTGRRSATIIAPVIEHLVVLASSGAD